MIKRLACLALLALPLRAPAQSFGGGVGWWTTTGGRNGEPAAHGLRIHAAITSRRARFDVEGAFTQAKFSRLFSNGRATVTESSIELAPLLRLNHGNTSWWPYLGPVVSVGIGCGTDGVYDSNGRVSCDPSSTTRSEGSARLGAVLGVAFAKAAGNVRLTANVRAEANTIASARGSGPVILVAVGLAGR